MDTRLMTVVVVLIGVQGLDILVHVAAGQVEVMRIASNLIISGGAVAAVFARTHAKTLILLAGVVYLVLNTVFVVQNGIVNPATNAPRLPLIGFVAVSLFALTWLGRYLDNHPDGG